MYWIYVHMLYFNKKQSNVCYLSKINGSKFAHRPLSMTLTNFVLDLFFKSFYLTISCVAQKIWPMVQLQTNRQKVKSILMEHKKKVPTLFDTCPLHLDMCSAGYRILSHYWPAWLPLFYSGNHHIGCLVLLLPLHALSHSGADQNLDLVPHLHNKHLHVHNELWFSDWLNQNAKILQNYFTLYFRSKFEYICRLQFE